MLNNRIGNRLTSRDIVDLMNMIGKCVIAGNIRRVAEIALGESNDSNFIALKDYT
jgi:ribonucleoside-triphosphate reductase